MKTIYVVIKEEETAVFNCLTNKYDFVTKSLVATRLFSASCEEAIKMYNKAKFEYEQFNEGNEDDVFFNGFVMKVNEDLDVNGKGKGSFTLPRASNIHGTVYESVIL